MSTSSWRYSPPSLPGVVSWYVNGAEMMVWGNYCNVLGGAAPVNIYYSTDSGQTVKIAYAFGQKRVMARPFGVNHAVIFWAFLVLLIALAAAVVLVAALLGWVAMGSEIGRAVGGMLGVKALAMLCYPLATATCWAIARAWTESGRRITPSIAKKRMCPPSLECPTLGAAYAHSA